MPVLITNGNDFSVTLVAADSSTIMIPAKAKNARVATKFDFALPRNVKVVGRIDDEPVVVEPEPEPVVEPETPPDPQFADAEPEAPTNKYAKNK